MLVNKRVLHLPVEVVGERTFRRRLGHNHKDPAAGRLYQRADNLAIVVPEDASALIGALGVLRHVESVVLEEAAVLMKTVDDELASV